MTAPRRPRPSKDVSTTVTVGAVSLPLYRLGDGRWCVTYPGPDGTRVRATRVNRDAAIHLAEELCVAIAHGDAAAGALPAATRVQVAALLPDLARRGLTLDGLVREAFAALDAVGGRASLLEIARDYAKRHPAGSTAGTVAEIRAAFLTAKSRLGLGEKYLEDLTRDLEAFAAAFPDRPMVSLGREEIAGWLRDRSVGWRRHNNLRNTLVTFFRHAARAGYLPEDAPTEAERVPVLPRPRLASLPSVFTPAELRLLLANVGPPWLPSFVLGAFAGIRTEERDRLVWERHILWEDGVIHVDETVAKHTTRRRGDVRFVEMRPNLLAWLAPWRQATGRIHPPTGEWWQETNRLRAHLPDGQWRSNALRHSYTSYLEAERGGNLAAVAGEAGNSPAILRKHYLNPRLRRQATEYFAIYPDGAGGVPRPSNVVSIGRVAG